MYIHCGITYGIIIISLAYIKGLLSIEHNYLFVVAKTVHSLVPVLKLHCVIEIMYNYYYYYLK